MKKLIGLSILAVALSACGESEAKIDNIAMAKEAIAEDFPNINGWKTEHKDLHEYNQGNVCGMFARSHPDRSDGKLGDWRPFIFVAKNGMVTTKKIEIYEWERTLCKNVGKVPA